MKTLLVCICALAICLGTAPAALATTQVTRSGAVAATFSYHGKYPNYARERLRISQGNQVYYDAPVTSKFCGRQCVPLSALTKQPSVHLADLEGTGQPDVVLDLYTGGAHCCTVEQFFALDPGTMTYVKTERNFGDPLVKLVDLDHTGRDQLVTANDAFAYEFTDFVDSGLPLEIFQFDGRHFDDVTVDYPKPVAKDAAKWLRAFKGTAKRHYARSTGFIAAWAADEDNLGKASAVSRYLRQQAKAGHLRSGLGPQLPSGKKFVAKLQRLLAKLGYPTTS